MITVIQAEREHPFLRSMVPEHRAVIVQGALDQHLAAGEILFREGQPANRLFLVHEGAIALEMHVPGHGDLPMATLGQNQVLGWSWLVAPYVWHFQARALQPTSITVLDGGHLLVASERNHYLGYELMKGIARVILESLQMAHQHWLDTNPSPVTPPLDEPGATILPAPSPHPIETRLADYPFFRGLADGQLGTMAELARPMTFERGQMIFKTGDTATGLYVIEQGQLTLEAARPGGSVRVQTINAGDTVGWSSFCEPYRWHFDGRTLAPTSSLFIAAADLRERCARDYHLGYELAKRTARIMVQRLQSTRNRMWEAFRSKAA